MSEVVPATSLSVMTESIVTQGDTWEEFRAMVMDALDAHFFGAPKFQAMLLHLACNELFG